MFLSEIIPLDPIDFFSFQIDCFRAPSGKLDKKHLLPDLSSFHGRSPFATVSLGWQSTGIWVTVSVKGSFDQPDFPNISNGDSIELFFDTRDVKTSGYNTRFCHHFFFLPAPFQNGEEKIEAGEITRFRNEEVHELCDPHLLDVRSTAEKKGRSVKIFIPTECLYGYDPNQFDRLGFTYRINRIDGSKQNFSASDADFTIESQPSLWASLKLIQ